MKKVNIHEAKTQLSALLSHMELKNEHIVICRSGKPIAEIVPYNQKQRTTISPSLKPIRTSGDLTAPSSEDWNV
jgi:antitoxin (DNA-binding transcriptional repressor) of toxin-antitoxin stability system